MTTKNKIALIIASLALGACDLQNDEKTSTDNSTDSSLIEDKQNQANISQLDLEGNAFIDEIGSGQFVIISFYPDKTVSDISNDNSNLNTRKNDGSWDLTGDDISISLTNETFIFRETRIDGYELSFLNPEKSERAILRAAFKPSISELGKEFYFSDCNVCTLMFDSNFTGISSGDGDGEFPFNWRYLMDGSVEIEFADDLGTVRYFFTENNGGELSFVGHHDYSDEPKDYLRKGLLIPN